MTRAVLALSILATTCQSLSAEERPLLDFHARLDSTWKRLAERGDGAKVWVKPGNVLLILRVFDAGGQEASQWLAREAGVQREQGAQNLKVFGKREVGDHAWYRIEYDRRLDPKRDPLHMVHSVTQYGPCLFEAYLGGPPELVKPEARRLGGILGAIELGSLSRVPRDALVPVGAPGDIEGTWRMETLETTGRRPETSAWFLPYQRFDFGADGSMRHMCHSQPITPDLLSVFERAPRRIRYEVLGDEGLIKVRHDGGARTESYAAYRVVRSPLPSAPASWPHEGDLLLFYKLRPDLPVIARLLRREKGEESASATRARAAAKSRKAPATVSASR